MVYYEALCSDSRDFIVRDLEPMYSSIGEIVDVEFVPYGKAQVIHCCVYISIYLDLFFIRIALGD